MVRSKKIASILARHEPFVGITCDVHVPKGRDFYELVCDYRYPAAVKRAGGYPILLPITHRMKIMRRYLKEIDGLIIVGGDDVDPGLYGEHRRKGTGTVFGPRMRFEVRMYHEARRRRMPIFGVCYGMQLINVLEGGSLFQDIRRDARSKTNHRNKKRPLHRIRVNPRSRLGRILGVDHARVHSEHHQAVRDVAPGFRPVAFSPDGIIEAIEGDRSGIMAVQWHPERTLHYPSTQRIFRQFVRMCRMKRASKHV